MKGADGIARALYLTASGKRVVVVRVFVKKHAEATARGDRGSSEKGEGRK